MTQTIIALEELRRLAHAHAMAVIKAKEKGDESLNEELLLEFQRQRQPFLSDKQYTALYRTYTDMLLTCIENYYAPGSRTEKPPVQVNSIKDGEEIYRPNAIPMNKERWDRYIAEVVRMAERFAFEIAELASSGGDAEARLEEQRYEAAKFSMDHGLSREEAARETEIYKSAFIRALQAETVRRTAR